MKRAFLALIAAVALAACASGGNEATQVPAPADNAFTAAIADSARPAADVARDVNRKPNDMLAFAQVSPGEHVAELLPGGGYFTRIFSQAVGSTGKVYAVVPPSNPTQAEQIAGVVAIAADPHYGNVQVVPATFTAIALPEPVDLVWTSQNYHDLHLSRLNVDVAAVNRSVFQALKPGGLYVIVDHAAANGSGLRDVDTLHRIDEAVVRREVEAAGFVFEQSTDALRNPADTRTENVFAPAIRGHTDQFVLRFRKPM
jgi:predicted methyltransferase